jgi:radical SAM superfamily enzyme YgiQ (UPF0313 family)
VFEKETRLAPHISKLAACALTQVGWYFPSSYEVGMSGLGYQLVWWLMEQRPELLIKRGFTDIEETGIESSHLFGFTVSWELDFINIAQILAGKGIPLTARERLEDADCPLIFGGGPVLSANPEPFVDYFDIILLGDAETSIPVFFDAYEKSKNCRSKLERLIEFSQIPGIYIPQLYDVEYNAVSQTISSIKPIYAGVPAHIDRQLFQAPPDYAVHTQILSSVTTWSNTFLIEVVRSCPQECRFCLASYLTRPFRATNIDTMIEKVDMAGKYTNRIGLLGPSVTEHPLFEVLAQKLAARPEIALTVASVRADSLTKNIVDTLKTLGQKSVTIAIESGSEKLRQVMKKNLSNEEIFQAVALIDEAGLSGVKFYGIVGLPYEEESDLQETVDLMKALKQKHRRLRFVFGVSSFVPKAQTPFQWAGRDRACQKKLEFLRKHLAKLGIEVRPESHNWSDIQTLISRGDRRLSGLLAQVAQTTGKLGDWKRNLKNLPTGTPELDYYVFREAAEDEILPWQHISQEAKTEYLLKHAREAKKLARI